MAAAAALECPGEAQGEEIIFELFALFFAFHGRPQVRPRHALNSGDAFLQLQAGVEGSGGGKKSMEDRAPSPVRWMW